MEILEINVFYGLYLAPIAVFLLASIMMLFDTLYDDESGYFYLGALLTIVGFILTAVIDPLVTYDVIVTDWNEVIEQGYEIVEQNGEIVTLRKVSE